MCVVFARNSSWGGEEAAEADPATLGWYAGSGPDVTRTRPGCWTTSTASSPR